MRVCVSQYKILSEEILSKIKECISNTGKTHFYTFKKESKAFLNFINLSGYANNLNNVKFMWIL